MVSLENSILNMTAFIACRSLLISHLHHRTTVSAFIAEFILSIHLFSITCYSNLLQIVYLTIFNNRIIHMHVIIVTDHSNCILPFLQDIPEGNWYCSSCLCDICGEVINSKELRTSVPALECLQCESQCNATCHTLHFHCLLKYLACP